MTNDLEQLRYPVGRFRPAPERTPADRAASIDVIDRLPERLRAAVRGLDDTQLDMPYRPGGWTVRQVVHHVPDSHANAYVRFKMTATAQVPTIATYDEAGWAELADGRLDVEVSLTLLEALHRRWVVFLKSLGDDDWSRRLNHPEVGEIDLDFLLQLYDWHSRHHVAHITNLREREGWG